MRNATDMNGFAYLHIEPRHTAALISLPHHHKDPFDRLLIAQAMVEGHSDTECRWGIRRIPDHPALVKSAIRESAPDLARPGPSEAR